MLQVWEDGGNGFLHLIVFFKFIQLSQEAPFAKQQKLSLPSSQLPRTSSDEEFAVV